MASGGTVLVIYNDCAMFSFLPEATRDFLCKMVSVLEDVEVPALGLSLLGLDHHLTMSMFLPRVIIHQTPPTLGRSSFIASSAFPSFTCVEPAHSNPISSWKNFQSLIMG